MPIINRRMNDLNESVARKWHQGCPSRYFAYFRKFMAENFFKAVFEYFDNFQKF